MEIFGETMHYDGTARVHNVSLDTSQYIFRLLIEKKNTAGQVPCLLNTSFNLSGNPIVEAPADAIRTFMASDLDILAIGPFIVEKSTCDISPME